MSTKQHCFHDAFSRCKKHREKLKKGSRKDFSMPKNGVGNCVFKVGIAFFDAENWKHRERALSRRCLKGVEKDSLFLYASEGGIEKMRSFSTLKKMASRKTPFSWWFLSASRYIFFYDYYSIDRENFSYSTNRTSNTKI